MSDDPLIVVIQLDQFVGISFVREHRNFVPILVELFKECIEFNILWGGRVLVLKYFAKEFRLQNI
eukprot:5795946-Ditylum_brightwellii.AAC.1